MRVFVGSTAPVNADDTSSAARNSTRPQAVPAIVGPTLLPLAPHDRTVM